MKNKVGIIAFVSLVILLIGCWAIWSVPIESVIVEGNQYHSAEEIEAILFGEDAHRSSLYYNMKEMANIKIDCVFLDDYTMTWSDIHTVKVEVKEKEFLGYVQSSGSNLYFGEEGIVIYSSQNVLENIPLVQGIKFKQLIKYQKLNTEDDSIFLSLMELTRNLHKYQVTPQTIRFQVNNRINLYIDDITIELGTTDYLEGKIEELAAMIESLQGRKGILRLDEYDGENPQKQYYFKVIE